MVVMLDTPCSRGGVKGTGYTLHSAVSPSLPLPCVTVCHHVSTGLYHTPFRAYKVALTSLPPYKFTPHSVTSKFYKKRQTGSKVRMRQARAHKSLLLQLFGLVGRLKWQLSKFVSPFIFYRSYYTRKCKAQ